MVGIITKVLRNKIWEVVQFGIDQDNGTRESLNQIMILEFPNKEPGDLAIDVGKEKFECKYFYQDQMGKNWVGKNMEEYHHYKFLTHALLHKINAVKYFHKEGLESRKLIIFSDDCISSIQLIVREEEVGLQVHMRSSDAINLLAPDLIALTQLLERVISQHRIEIYPGKRVMIHITFGSLHIYKKDLEIAKKVGTSHSGEVYDEKIRCNF